ncbi:hypothetical protein Hdeb2414_s0008g00281021 [Helianthus debilis subsp. tardiflorus]
MLDKRHGSLGKKRVKWNLYAREAYLDARMIGSRRINKGQRSWTESHEGLYGVSKNFMPHTRSQGQVKPPIDKSSFSTPSFQIMSGADSSSNPKKRRIKYRGNDRRVYARIDRLVDHPMLDFEEGTEERVKLKKYVVTQTLEHRVIDWEWLQSMGASERVAELLGPRLRMAMDACNEKQYTELTIEFHCTFRHKEGAFSEANAVSFSLGRNLYEMTIPQFGMALGLYSPEEVATEEFVNGLRGAFNHARPKSLCPAELGEFWDSISAQPFSHTNLITSVRDPIYRYILKVLATTVVARKSGENKVNWLDIFALMCMVEKRN